MGVNPVHSSERSANLPLVFCEILYFSVTSDASHWMVNNHPRLVFGTITGGDWFARTGRDYFTITRVGSKARMVMVP